MRRFLCRRGALDFRAHCAGFVELRRGNVADVRRPHAANDAFERAFFEAGNPAAQTVYRAVNRFFVVLGGGRKQVDVSKLVVGGKSGFARSSSVFICPLIS